ncbi:MAG: hypothetical protein BECKG1743E_GA0114224_109912, partial [Candidatus Kentron sp. G]
MPRRGCVLQAQGCREATTLGKHNPTAQPQRGCVKIRFPRNNDATPLGLISGHLLPR